MISFTTSEMSYIVYTSTCVVNSSLVMNNLHIDKPYQRVLNGQYCVYIQHFE